MQTPTTGLQQLASPESPRLPFDPARLTEGILALSDMAVLLTGANQEIMYCSQSISSLLGYQSDDIRTGGWPHIFSLMIEADRKVLEQKLVPAARSFFRNLPDEERKACIFNYTVRVRNAQGSTVMLAVENQPMEWKTDSWPSMYMTVLKNITPFANKEKMIFTVSKRKGGDGQYEDILMSNFDFKFEPFTPREVEIMRMISRGLTSNQMADKLFLSPETIRNHRKNIMRKAGVPTNAQLAAYVNNKGML